MRLCAAQRGRRGRLHYFMEALSLVLVGATRCVLRMDLRDLCGHLLLAANQGDARLKLNHDQRRRSN